MHDLPAVRGFERIGDLACDAERLVGRNRALGDAVGERRSVHELHDDDRVAAGLVESVDVRDVGVIQRGEDLGFALEARDAVLVVGESLRQDLDGHVSLEARIGRPVDLAHAAGADTVDDLVRAEALTW
jgi:hypothetical protein